ncbi:MAG: AbrB/MazE/SpoVT family DNA-binding domain-containing protein [Rhodoplanes sp.]|uniref:AbrB/MazE/SpoVT family DNA-binding domain-containing protein n=1 Tax=Rhodoplanes sp. TaxID=1968906 RepID=UPI0017DA88D7|nr:AbrB/MazE/SpoVT family DNA-binding domain-containing protein [Rhodoplanes sp.]NVO15078.1 AbrB/MazE/SpoVT family DNA-binding domain-containing protein [Rhodoplanes sp.]
MGTRETDRNGTDKLPDRDDAFAEAKPAGSISDVFGLLKRKGGPVLTTEEINGIAAKGWAGEL